MFPSKTATEAVDEGDYEEYGYDSNGNRTSLRKRDGQVLGFAYDALNRVTIKDAPGPERDVRYGYDLRGLQTSASFTWTGHGVSNVYDGFGRNVSTTSNMGGISRTVSHKFDSEGRRTELAFPDGAKAWFARDRLGRMTEGYQGAIGDTSQIMVAFAYHAAGPMSHFARKYGDWTNYAHDPVGRLAGLHDSFPGVTGSVAATFAYNPASQLVRETRDNDSYAWTGSVAVSRASAIAASALPAPAARVPSQRRPADPNNPGHLEPKLTMAIACGADSDHNPLRGEGYGTGIHGRQARRGARAVHPSRRGRARRPLEGDRGGDGDRARGA